MLKLDTKPSVILVVGFDCDRPRDAFIISKEGQEMAERKIKSITNISKSLNDLQIPRTFFVCGHFLESMNYKYGSERLRESFDINNQNVEIADHSYSHNVLKPIITRPDKIPLTPEKVFEEFQKNTKIFENIFGEKFEHRGYRTPLGHFQGLTKLNKLLEKMKLAGVKYISSDLRGPNDSINAELKNQDGSPRQPYFYENNILEIPSMGWQDVVFSPYVDHVAKFEKIPDNSPFSYEKIIEYYQDQLSKAQKIADESNQHYFYGLCMHPYDTSYYFNEGKFFVDLKKIIEKINGKFTTYDDVDNYFKQKQ